MSADANWTGAGSTTAMRNGESLVQIEMADVGAVLAGSTQAALCVHIGTIKINLAALLMDKTANFSDVFIENAEYM